MELDDLRKKLSDLGEEKRTLPERQRRLAREAKEAGIPATEIAFRLDTTATTIYAWLKSRTGEEP